MAGTFSSLQLNSQVCSAPSIPLVLQSDYQWNNSTSTVERGSHADDTQVLDHELQLVPEAIDMLKTIQKPVAVLAICGPYRSGKSFFISRVVGKPGTFKLGHSMDGCTRGIWLSTTALECEEFVLLVLDTEGIGAVEGEGPESFTTKLLVTTILLSSFFVYNSMEVPKQADLQQMSSFAHLTTAIKVKEKQDRNDPNEFKRYFPIFMWLLRDVINPPCNEDGEDIPLIDFLCEEVLVPTGQKDRDNVINAICTLFPQPLMCESLPLPNDDPELCNLDVEENLDKDFVMCASEVIDRIKASVVPKVGYEHGVQVTGSELAELAKFYIKAINKKESVPSLEGSWKAVIKLKLDKEAEVLIASYEQQMSEELAGDEPIEESMEETDCESSTHTLMKLHSDIFAAKRKVLLEKISQLLPKSSKSGSSTKSDSEDSEDVIQHFESRIVVKENSKVKSGILHKFITQNHATSEKQCSDLWKRLEDDSKIEEEYIRAINKYRADLCENVINKIKILREEYNVLAMGPAREATFMSKNDTWISRQVVLESIPGPPQNVTVVGKARDAIKLQWDEPKINPKAATKYIVEFRKGTKAWVKDTETPNQWHIVRQLKSNTMYEFRVSSWNDEAEKVKKTIEEMLRAENREFEEIKRGTRLGRLARATLATIGLLGGTAVAPFLATVGMPALALESERSTAAAACVTIPFFATLGAPIVGGKVAYEVIQATGDWGDLEERYVPQDTLSSSLFTISD